MRAGVVVLAIGALLSTSAFAQTPDVINGTLQTHASTRGLAREVSALMTTIAQPAWMGYAVKTRPHDSGDGCWTDGVNRRSRTPVKLEGSDEVIILYRLDEKRVDRVLNLRFDLIAAHILPHGMVSFRSAICASITR